jgi:hypothetical protein
VLDVFIGEERKRGSLSQVKLERKEKMKNDEVP